MKNMTRMSVLIFLPIALLGGCVTAAEERARCQEMARQMGTQTRHDHGETKGTGSSPMNQAHRRCQQILAQPQ